MKKKICMVVCLLLFCSTNYATAGIFACSGLVQSLAFGPTNGILQVNTGHGEHNLCRFDAEYHNVDPEVCKAWYSMFLTALVTNREVVQFYQDSAGTNCSTLGTSAVPNPMPYYVTIKSEPN